ncbi:THUMP domain-containing class I SAM-dependent RNA methyltransferase [Shimia aestuarii]|uniref:THUMP domain-containing class I SAM-dependent RNA methyltransferase n=1 Tax=Shimia aestuarii TaxID=254406 RepID=UPI001FB5568F|nr:class I SAM-dependent RNA methyltransferase [Shimia aestuarii]
MKNEPLFEIFLQATPGLEVVLRDEAVEAGFRKPKATAGGVRFRGRWSDVWRANLVLRGASRVLVRIAAFQAMHLTQLEKLASELPWNRYLRADVPVRVEVTTRRSKIYHAGAARERVERALGSRGLALSEDAAVSVRVRIEENQCVFSLDTSGELLHKRGYKEAVAKAPMRETLAALFLRAAGFDGAEPVLDPMCGSGTFVIEAAEMAAGLAPGRARSFAFEHLATFDADAWAEIQAELETKTVSNKGKTRFIGSDRNAGAIDAARANAARAGVLEQTNFDVRSVGDLERPEGPAGLVIVNPPYGARIGDKRGLFALHSALGQRLKEHFQGWRVGIVTTEESLARATGLPFEPPGPPVAHGGLKVRLYQTKPL